MSLKFQREFAKFKKYTAKEPTQYHALLGKTPTVVEHPTRKGYCYARMADNLSELITVFNDKVSQSYDLPVIIERRGLTWFVVGRDVQRYADWGTASPFLPKHHGQHEFNRDAGTGADAVFIYPDQFMPLLVFPSGTSGAGNLQIAPYVLQRENDFIYVGNTGTPNLLTYKPTDSTGIMGLVYLDTLTGNPGILIASGTPFVGTLTGTASLLPYVPYPTSAEQEPLYFFRLVSGTTSINWGNLYNARQLIGGGAGGTGTSGGGFGTLTPKRIPITDSVGTVTTSDYIIYDETTKILTLGESVIGFVQSVIWNLSSNISRVLNMITWGSGNSSRFKGTFARGSISSATATLGEDALVRFSGAGYDGNTSIQNAATSAEIKIEAAEDFDSTHHGTNIGVWVTLTGTTSMVRVGTFTGQGLNLELGYEYLIGGNPIGVYNSYTEVDFGTSNFVEKEFTITDSNVTPSSTITASLKYLAPTGKDLDELTMDNFDFLCAPDNGFFTLRMVCLSGSVSGKFKIAYSVG